MDEEIERLVVSVRADTATFRRDVAAMRGDLDEGLGSGAARAGRAIETSLLHAVRTGKLGFDDLKVAASRALSEIAASAIGAGIGSIGGAGGGGQGGGLFGSLIGVVGTLLGGRAGRATGGPVAPGQAYMVGERGPELFVPTASGRIETGAARGGGRDVRIAITVNARGDDAPAALQRSSRQVARAVRAALLADD